MSTELRPTPECDANAFVASKAAAFVVRKIVGGEHHGLYDAIPLKLGETLERERDSAKKLNRTLLDQLEAQAVQIKAMREAIKDAHYALDYVYNHGEGSCAFPFRTDDDLCSENRFYHVKDALDALAAFPNV